MTDKNKKLWAFNDAHNWGAMLVSTAAARGYDAHLFEDGRELESKAGMVFVHMHHHPQVRDRHKRMMAALALNPHLQLIPDYRSSVLFDDKLEQQRQFAKWMPNTQVLTTPGSAKKFLNNAPKFPIVSKSSEGAASHNVRILETPAQANEEMRFAFSDIGIKAKYGQEQRGYLLWQEFLPGNDGDIRIIAIGSQRLILRRFNRPERPQAGSTNVKPITKLDAELEQALDFANSFFDQERLRWAGIDIVKDHRTGAWRVLETTVGWTLHGYYECAFFDAGNKPTGRLGSDVWSVLLDEIDAGAFA